MCVSIFILYTRECTDFYEKYCFDGSACFRPQCDGQGNIFCETGQDLVEVDDPLEICKNSKCGSLNSTFMTWKQT